MGEVTMTLQEKPIHLANLMRGDGMVSALCCSKPRAIDLTRANWTNRREAVTCIKCLAILSKES